MPIFPLTPILSCRHCFSTPLSATLVPSPNANGNANRPYFFCAACNEKQALTLFAFTESNPGWMTWNDALGVEPGNPVCECGLWSRFDRAGSESRIGAGKGFFNCAVGGCRFWVQGGEGLDVPTDVAAGEIMRAINEFFVESWEPRVGNNGMVMACSSSQPEGKEERRSRLGRAFKEKYQLEGLQTFESILMEKRDAHVKKFLEQTQIMLEDAMEDLRASFRDRAAKFAADMKICEGDGSESRDSELMVRDLSLEDVGAMVEFLSLELDELRDGPLRKLRTKIAARTAARTAAKAVAAQAEGLGVKKCQKVEVVAEVLSLREG